MTETLEKTADQKAQFAERMKEARKAKLLAELPSHSELPELQTRVPGTVWYRREEREGGRRFAQEIFNFSGDSAYGNTLARRANKALDRCLAEIVYKENGLPIGDAIAEKLPDFDESVKVRITLEVLGAEDEA